MPPTRTMPPAKAVKTERTHEENQERAYIAASRRSDRSLEARVESARRASEIHKRRTGRSLRVTEQDVVNEEMYEEEDDDLPGQYRRLTAHLQTGSADFNRRLSAYLANHVAMRSAVEEAVQASYSNQYAAVGPQFGTNTMFPSPMLAHQGQQQMMQQPSSPTTYRQAPYPPRPQSHNRSNSVATTQDTLNSPMVRPNNDRRTSMQISTDSQSSTDSPVDARSPFTPSLQTQQRPSFPTGTFSQSNQYGYNTYDSNANTNYGPFSLALPGNAQGLLGSTVTQNDNLSNMMMAGSDTQPGNFYNFDAQLPNTTSINKQNSYQGLQGLNTTLAPSALDLNKTSTHDFDFDQAFDGIAKTEDDETAGTPGVNVDSWEGLISWDIPSGSQ